MKTFKKSFGLVLALIMLFTCCGGVMASAADYDHLPQIYVEGYVSKPIYCKDDPNKTSLFVPLDTDRMFGMLGNLGDYANQSIMNMDPRVVYNCIYSWLYDCFGLTALEPDGVTMSDKVTLDPTTLNYEGNGKYVFRFDSRLDPTDLAKELDAYIDQVQAHSGSERFELASSSYGTTIAIAYLKDFKGTDNYNNIDSVVLCVPSVGGVNFIGELFSGSYNFDPDALEEFLEVAVGNEDVNLLLSFLNKLDILDVLLDDALEPLLRNSVLSAFTDIIRDIFGTYPSAWTFVKDEYFVPALINIFGEDYADSDHEYAVLIGKIMNYHENYMLKCVDIYKDAQQEGKHVNIICKYNVPTIPLSEYGNYMGDSLVDLPTASFGATCSPLYNQPLPEGYEQADYTDYSFISTDGFVDASTGAIPFNTWYIKNLDHGVKPREYYNLINAVLYLDLDVFTNPDYPQFLELSDEDPECLIPMKPYEPEKETSFVVDIIALLIRVFTYLFDYIKTIL